MKYRKFSQLDWDVSVLGFGAMRLPIIGNDPSQIEVEAEDLAQVQECLDCRADIIMLDNMSLETMRQAVRLINGQALVEASGGVTLEKVSQIAQTGVDIISVGRLTHSAPSSDISMDF